MTTRQSVLTVVVICGPADGTPDCPGQYAKDGRPDDSIHCKEDRGSCARESTPRYLVGQWEPFNFWCCAPADGFAAIPQATLSVSDYASAEGERRCENSDDQTKYQVLQNCECRRLHFGASLSLHTNETTKQIGCFFTICPSCHDHRCVESTSFAICGGNIVTESTSCCSVAADARRREQLLSLICPHKTTRHSALLEYLINPPHNR